MIKTELCQLLGVQYPIMQAPMGPYDTTELAAAVSNAGGFGVVSHPGAAKEVALKALDSPAEYLEELIEDVKAKVRNALHWVKEHTDCPFGLNLRVAPEHPEVPNLVDMIIEEREKDQDLKKKLRLIITSAGDPGQLHLKKIQEAGMLRFHTVPSVYHARKAEQSGVDAIVATGYEAGGHVAYQPVHTFVLIPAVVEAVKVPVIAGGGICDGAGLVAALAFGAAGIYIGTRFIASKECEFHPRSKEEIIQASKKFPKEASTIVTEGFFGPLRHLKNAYSRKLYELTQSGADRGEILQYEFNGIYLGFGPEGNVENGALWAGQVAERLDKILPAKEIIDRVMKEAEEKLRSLPQRFLSP